MQRGFEVRDRFDYAEVCLYGGFDEVFAVARDGARGDLNPALGLFINFAQFFDDYVERLTVVGLVVRI